MKLAIIQPYFFPYIGYWQLIRAVDHFVIYDDVNYAGLLRHIKQALARGVALSRGIEVSVMVMTTGNKIIRVMVRT